MEVWCEHYCNIFSSVESNVVVLENVDLYENMKQFDQMMFMMPDYNNACGMDYVTTEHLKNATHSLGPLLAMSFIGFIDVCF